MFETNLSASEKLVLLFRIKISFYSVWPLSLVSTKFFEPTGVRVIFLLNNVLYKNT